jgi:tetratricopeptide (TPR) repeat protein
MFILSFSCYSVVFGADKDAQEHNKLGMGYLDKEEYELALKEFNLAIQIDPHYAEAIKNRGNVYFFQNKFEAALKEYLKAISVDPGYWNAYNNAANAYWELEKVQDAMDYYDKAIKADPSAMLPYWNAANKYLDLKQYDSAAKYFEKGLSVEPKNSIFHNYLGYTLYKLERTEDALSHLNKAIAINPKDSLPYYDLAGIYYDKAIIINKRYVESTTNTDADKKNAEKAFNLYQEAEKNFSKAVELEPDNPAYRYRLGLTYFALIEDEKALEQYQKGIELAREQGKDELVKLMQEQIKKINELKEKREGGKKK